MDIRFLWMPVTVAVHGEPIHDIDINDMFFTDMSAEAGYHLCQRLQPGVLIAVHDAAAGFCTGAVYVNFAV